MTGLWVGLGVVAVSVAWLGWELWRAPLMPADYDPADAWGDCPKCAAQAEVAELQAIWEMS